LSDLSLLIIAEFWVLRCSKVNSLRLMRYAPSLDSLSHKYGKSLLKISYSYSVQLLKVYWFQSGGQKPHKVTHTACEASKTYPQPQIYK
jgi:hypothetical protein